MLGHGSQESPCKPLAEVVDAGSMIILHGHGDPATGKSRLLRYFATEYWPSERATAKDWNPIVYVDHKSLAWSTKPLSGSESPVVAQVLSVINAELADIAQKHRPDHPHLRYSRKQRSIKTPSQTLWLYNEVCHELKRLRVRAVLIDNAESIDRITLQSLVELRKSLVTKGHPLALIFAARLAKNEALNEPMEHLFMQAKVDPHDFEVPIELEVLTQDAFFDEVLESIIEDLELEFEPQLEAYQAVIAERLWERTRGDWKSIDQQVKRFNRELGRRTGKRGTSLKIDAMHKCKQWSGRRDSNARHSAWKADALPTELHPHCSLS